LGNTTAKDKNITPAIIISKTEARCSEITKIIPFARRINAKTRIKDEGIIPNIPKIQNNIAEITSIIPKIFTIILVKNLRIF